jgi:hypothetical protein
MPGLTMWLTLRDFYFATYLIAMPDLFIDSSGEFEKGLPPPIKLFSHVITYCNANILKFSIEVLETSNIEYLRISSYFCIPFWL